MARSPVVIAEPVAREGRRIRNPRHSFNLRHQPYQIQPFFIAPVLPGETMRNLLIQSRAVTDPLISPLIGWWLEYYVFYVKHRDLEEREHFTEMMLDAEYDLSSLYDNADTPTYHRGGGINWTRRCLNRVVAEYFRNEGEALTPSLGGLPQAKINQESLWDSAVSDADITWPEDVDVDANNDGTITAGEVSAAMRHWQNLVAHGLTEMSYEDYLRTYGVRTQAEEHHRPELVRYIREWTYPTNTVEPTSGIPSSACSWSIAERADKDRFFKEPGFLFGVSVCRPKVYFRNQRSAGVYNLNDALAWLPAVLLDDPMTSMRKFAGETDPGNDSSDAEGLYPGAQADYWLDLKDLFMHGDQFVNFDMSDSGQNPINASYLPSAETGNPFGKSYMEAFSVGTLFQGESSANLIRQDGVVSLQIAGRLSDTSRTTV